MAMMAMMMMMIKTWQNDWPPGLKDGKDEDMEKCLSTSFTQFEMRKAMMMKLMPLCIDVKTDFSSSFFFPCDVDDY